MWDSFSTSKDEPIFVVRGVSFDLTLLLIVVHSAAFVISGFLLAFGGGAILNACVFTPELFLQGHVWQILTYPFAKATSASGLSLFFVIEMLMLWFFGRPVEQHLGRRAFLNFYIWMWATLPLVFTLLSFVGISAPVYGSNDLNYGVFVAFVCIYPGVRMLLNIQARWWLLGGLAIFSLLALSAHAWPMLVGLWWVNIFGWTLMRHAGVSAEILPLSIADWIPKRKPRFTIVREPQMKTKRRPDPAPVDLDNLRDEMDTLLDKIAEVGIARLTPAERKRLEVLRMELLEGDAPSGGKKP